MTDITTYHSVLLVERALSAGDAQRLVSLHEGLDQPVVYHLLMPLEDAAARVEASMGSLAGSEMVASPIAPVDTSELEAVEASIQRQTDRDLAISMAALKAAGAQADGVIVDEPPVDALAAAVSRYDAEEAIILTAPHVVAEFFHLDWTSKARRHLGVPVLHLLEHESFDEQAGGGEGVTGL